MKLDFFKNPICRTGFFRQMVGPNNLRPEHRSAHVFFFFFYCLLSVLFSCSVYSILRVILSLFLLCSVLSLPLHCSALFCSSYSVLFSSAFCEHMRGPRDASLRVLACVVFLCSYCGVSHRWPWLVGLCCLCLLILWGSHRWLACVVCICSYCGVSHRWPWLVGLCCLSLLILWG
jgi:hypothetical protein